MNNKAITKVQAAVIAVIVVAIAVAGTYFAATSMMAPESKVTLTVITQYQTGADFEAMAAVNDLFMEKYPNVFIKHSPMPWLEFNTIIPVWMGTDSAPDVWQWWGGAKTKFIANQGHILDLSEISTTLQNEFPAGVYDEYATANGKAYAVPNFLHSHGIFYNKAIFAEYSIEVPQTWNELVAACDTIWTESSGTVYPFVVGAMFPWLPDMQFANVLGKTVGGDFFNRLVAGQESWTDPKVVEALEHYGELVPYMPPYITELDEMGVAAEFAEGNVAMEIQGIWRGAMCEEAGMSEADIGWFGVPEITPAYAHTMGSAADVLVGSSNTLYPDEVKLYLEFWATTEAQEAWSEASARVSPSKNIPMSFYTKEYTQEALQYSMDTTDWVTEFGLAVGSDELKLEFRNILQEFLQDPTDAAGYCARIDDLDWRTD